MIDGKAQNARLTRQALYWAVSAFLFLITSQVSGQEIRLSLETAIQKALATTPELAIAQSQTDAARGALSQAALRPNPRLTLQSEDIRPGTAQLPFSFVNSTEDYVYVSQNLEIAGKRRGRMDVANGGIGIAEDQQQLTRRQIVTRVTAAYWNAVLTRRLRDLAVQSLQTYNEDVTYTGNRVKEGIAAENDLISIRIERDRIRASLLLATRDSDQAMVSLCRSMGQSEFPPAVLTTELTQQREREIPKLEQALALRKEIAIARVSVNQAESNLKLQHAYAKPDPQIFVGYKRNVGYDTAYGALQIDLPIHNRNQGNIQTATAQLRIAQSTLQLTTAAVRADYEAAVRAYQDGQALLATLPPLIMQAQDAEQRARAAYREGGIELLRLLDAERSRLQSETDYARALAAIGQSTVQLQLATGEDLGGDPIK